MLRTLLIAPDRTEADTLARSLRPVTTVVHVTTLSAARERLNYTAFDALVSTYPLPGEDVLSLLPTEAPLLLVTGQRDAALAVEAFRAGVADYLITEEGYKTRLQQRVVEVASAAFQRGVKANLSFDANVAAHLIMTHDMRPLACNPIAARMLGYGTVREAMSQPSWAFHFDEQSIAFLRDRLTVQTVVQQHSDLLRTTSGGRISVLANVAIHGPPQGTHTLEMTLIDITAHTTFGELSAINADLESRVLERTQALEDAKNWTQFILDKTHDAIVLTDSSGRIKQVNARFNELFGYSGDTYYKQPIGTLFCDEDAAHIRAMLANQHETSGYRELRALTEEGQPFHAEVGITTVPHEQGEASYLFNIHSVEDRKRAERRLRQFEADLRAIFDNASIGLVLFDDEMSIRTANKVAAQVIYDLWATHPRDPSIEERLEGEFLDGFKRSFEGALQGQTIQKEANVTDRFGRPLHLALTYTPVIDERANVTGVCMVTENITARKQAEAALRASEQRYRDVTELISDYAYSIVRDENGELDVEWITVASFERLSGYDIDEDTSVDEVLRLVAHKEDSQRSLNDLLRTFEGESVSGQYRLVKRDGSIRWIHITRRPVWDEDAQAYTRVVGAVRDITEQLEMEHALREALHKEKELNEMKSRFVSMVSHEFRTPLATIQAATDLLQKHADQMTPEKRARRYTKIRQQIAHMTLMLEDVLTIGRFEAGTVEFRPVTVEFTGFVNELIEEQTQTYDTHTIQQMGFEQPIHLTGDLKLLRQTVTNLLSNARKYSEAGTTITVQLMQEGGRVRLCITDEGIGIPPEDLPQLFEAFHRAGNVGTIQGNGLGLSIIKQAVDLHGGELSVESTLNVGTTFTVELPLQPDAVAVS